MSETCKGSTAAAAAAAATPTPRVLSIQSHTVHGYVGNKAAVFPLQLLGFEVDPVNSVQFSNHTGYAAGWTGEVLQGAQLNALVDGLESNALLAGYSHMLTGYIGSASFLSAVLKTLGRVRAASPGVSFLCDPVMGDHGKLYVPEELVQIYREQVRVSDFFRLRPYPTRLTTGRLYVPKPGLYEQVQGPLRTTTNPISFLRWCRSRLYLPRINSKLSC